MKRLWCALFIITVYAQDVENHRRARIIGGTYAPINDFPYQAQIISGDRIICGAAIISEHWIITAAHCLIDIDIKTLNITTGSSFSFRGEKHEIDKHIIHPNHNKLINMGDHDIALMKVKNPIEFNDRQRSIPLANESPKTGDIMKISGYGWESYTSVMRQKRDLVRKSPAISRLLKWLRMQVIDHDICVNRYAEIRETVTNNSFCAQSGSQASSCIADSGGPGVINGKLAGIVSAGYLCNASYYPAIYTDVFRHRNWIEQETKIQAE